MSMDNALPFVSPISKLLRFFYRSRDQWKAKCKAAKGENKSLKYRLAKMTESRDRWKAEAKTLRQSLPKGAVSDQVQTKTGAAERAHRRRRRCVRPGVAVAR